MAGNIRGGWAGVALLALLVVIAIMFVLYFGPLGQGGKSYTQAVVESKKQAREEVQGIELSNFFTELQVAATTHDGVFPPKSEQLKESAIADKLLNGHGQAGPLATYIQGQNASMSINNVLVYPNSVGPQESGYVLLLGGQVVSMTGQEIDKAVAATRERLGHGGKS